MYETLKEKLTSVILLDTKYTYMDGNFFLLNYINSILSMWLMQYKNISISDICREFFPKK